MPIETHWANSNQSILIEKFYDVWTWQQVADECKDVIRPQLDGLRHPIVLIQDMVGSHWTPTTNLLKEVQQMMQTAYPKNVVLVLVSSGNPAIDTLVVSAYQRYGTDECVYQTSKTVNQAISKAGDFLEQL